MFNENHIRCSLILRVEPWRGGRCFLGRDSVERPHNQPQEMGVEVETAAGVSAAVRTDQTLREQNL